MKFIDGYYAKDQDGAAYWYEKMPVSRQYDLDRGELIPGVFKYIKPAEEE